MMLPKLVKRLSYASRNISIMAIALAFVESQYCLPNSDNILINTEFTKARQLVSVNNRRKVQD